jgi:hypothetical protein
MDKTKWQWGHKSHYLKIQSMKKEAKISSKDLSKFSKHLLFLSFHKHQKRQIGIIFQIVALLGLPDVHQQVNSSITLLGITQDKPKWVNRALYEAEATSQWRRRWSTDSSFLLHLQHLFIIITCFFLRLSKVRILPRAAGHTEKSLSRRNLSPPHTLPREATTFRASQRRVKERLDLEQTSFGRDPQKPIFTTSSHKCFSYVVFCKLKTGWCLFP